MTADERRLEREIKQVRAMMAAEFPGAVDWNVIDESLEQYAEVLDVNDKRLAVISEAKLTSYWNDL
jgi:hypothetical protein